MRTSDVFKERNAAGKASPRITATSSKAPPSSSSLIPVVNTERASAQYYIDCVTAVLEKLRDAYFQTSGESGSDATDAPVVCTAFGAEALVGDASPVWLAVSTREPRWVGDERGSMRFKIAPKAPRLLLDAVRESCSVGVARAAVAD